VKKKQAGPKPRPVAGESDAAANDAMVVKRQIAQKRTPVMTELTPEIKSMTKFPDYAQG
jgi:hypothetical protein